MVDSGGRVAKAHLSLYVGSHDEEGV